MRTFITRVLSHLTALGRSLARGRPDLRPLGSPSMPFTMLFLTVSLPATTREVPLGDEVLRARAGCRTTASVLARGSNHTTPPPIARRGRIPKLASATI